MTTVLAGKVWELRGTDNDNKNEIQTAARNPKLTSDSDPATWAEPLRTDKSGPLRDEENVRIALANDPRLSGIVKYNEFSGELMLMRPLPGSDEAVVAERGIPRRWADADTAALTMYLQRTTLPRIARDKVEATIGAFARYSCSFHPLREFLQTIQWDGIPRVSSWLFDYVGVGPSQGVAYIEAVGQAFLVSAVARVFEPGCQADCALVLEGEQGTGKSSALRILAGDEWFSDSLPSDLRHKDAKDHLRGKWIIELPELAQFKRNDVETLKAFLSRRDELFRPSYGRHEIRYPRQCVFAGSTNEAEYLVDTTGNRRFWCVSTGRIDLDALRRDREQLWAEAVALYRRGEPWHLTGDVAAEAAREASSRVAVDPWTAQVASVLENLPPMRTDVTPSDVLDAMEVSTEQKHHRSAGRVGTILRDLGWIKGPRHRTRGQLYLRPGA